MKINLNQKLFELIIKLSLDLLLILFYLRLSVIKWEQIETKWILNKLVEVLDIQLESSLWLK